MIRNRLDLVETAVQVGLGLGAGVAYVFGTDFMEMLAWIIVLMVTDHVTAILGVLISTKERFRWGTFIRGLAKKIAMLFAFLPAGALDRGLVFMDLISPEKHPTVAFVLISLVVHEAGSNVKNITRAAGRLPWLVELARRIRSVSPAEGEMYGRRDTDLNRRPDDG